jgi:hypothetical protein
VVDDYRMPANNKQIKYNDHWFILLAIPFIAALNYYLTYHNIQLNAFLIITFVLDTLEGYCAWYAARTVIVYLDGKILWEHNPVKRLLIQVPLVAIVIVVVLSILTETVNAIARNKPVDPSFYRYDIFIFMIWSLMINTIYIGMYFYQHSKKVVPEKQFILSKNGNVQKMIYLSEITFATVENQCTMVVCNSGKQILADYTLEKLEKALDTQSFFRANRQSIITKGIIDKVSREKDGKLILHLKKVNDLPENVVISRLKAGAFKQWISDTSVS